MVLAMFGVFLIGCFFIQRSDRVKAFLMSCGITLIAWLEIAIRNLTAGTYYPWYVGPVLGGICGILGMALWIRSLEERIWQQMYQQLSRK